MQNKTFGLLVKDMLLALINATLLLAAICLWLAWQVSDTISSAASEFASSLISLEPLREDVRLATAELSELRVDLASVGQKTGEAGSEAIVQVRARAEELETRVSAVLGKLEDIATQPEILINYTIDQAATSAKGVIGEVVQCKSEELAATNN